MLHILFMLFASLFLISCLMSILWVVYYYSKNIGVVDIGWALSFMMSAFVYLTFTPNGYSVRKGFLMILILIWSLRLAWHLYRRFSLSEQDPRYNDLLKSWKGNRDVGVFLLFLLQGLISVILSLPFALSFNNPRPYISGIEILGFFVWSVGVIGESIADQQLYEFKKDLINRSSICDRGLWYYSRHPNYFFEWVVWVGYALICLAAPYGWIGIFSPLFMLYLLLRVSGVPLAESQALKTRGEMYKQYQRSTSKFFPWFKKYE